MEFDYEVTAKKARTEIEKLKVTRANTAEQLAALDQRIAALTQTFNAIAPLIGEQPLPNFAPYGPDMVARAVDETGITSSIRKIFLNSKSPMSPTEIRDELQVIGFDLSGYANALSTIHTVIQRLVKGNEVRPVAGSDGKKYEWARPRASTAPGPIKPVRA